MAAEQRFLTHAYGSYHQAALPPADDTLVRVGRGTPGDEYLRRFWHPVAQSEMVADLPVAIRILGEDLVVFRDRGGAVGLLDRHCTHRGTSLEYGKIEERGIRCCYHGWLFDVDGAILETPAEPDGNPYQGKLYQGAYPVIEYNGLIFAYMGPPDKKPPLRKFEMFDQPGLKMGLGEPLGGNLKPCNWLQIMDNVVDPVHEAYLHASISGVQFKDATGRLVEELADRGVDDYWETAQGITCNVARRVGDTVWVRSMEYVCPNVVQLRRMPMLPPDYPDGEDTLGTGPFVTRWRVPVDDEQTVEFAFVFYLEGEARDYTVNTSTAFATNFGDRPYDERQRIPGDWDAQVSQRPIAVHANEHLASSDRGVALMRRMVREGIEAVQQGEDPRGVVRDADALMPVYANEIVRRLPPAPTPEEDQELLRQTSRAAFEDARASPPAPYRPRPGLRAASQRLHPTTPARALRPARGDGAGGGGFETRALLPTANRAASR